MILTQKWTSEAMAGVRAADPDEQIIDADTARAVIDGLATIADDAGRVVIDPRTLIVLYGPADPVVTVLALLVEKRYADLNGLTVLRLRYPPAGRKDDEPLTEAELAGLAARWA